MRLINRWIVREPECDIPLGCVIVLPGRDISADAMEKFSNHLKCDRSLNICVEPKGLEWYPQPNGIEDQENAIEGMKLSLEELNNWISDIEKMFGFTRDQIALVGFSAGGVMALQMGIITKEPFAAIGVMAGAILDTENVPEAQTETPILLRHAIDDDVFSWEERFLPMKNVLIEKNYNLCVSEKREGKHGVQRNDPYILGRFISSYLGYEEIYHVEEDVDIEIEE